MWHGSITVHTPVELVIVFEGADQQFKAPGGEVKTTWEVNSGGI